MVRAKLIEQITRRSAHRVFKQCCHFGCRRREGIGARPPGTQWTRRFLQGAKLPGIFEAGQKVLKPRVWLDRPLNRIAPVRTALR